jgi:hypothetical protein
MALGKSTKPLNASFGIPEFHLPVDAEFHALPPAVNLEEYCRLNQEFRELFPKGIATEQERLSRKVLDVFVF